VTAPAPTTPTVVLPRGSTGVRSWRREKVRRRRRQRRAAAAVLFLLTAGAALLLWMQSPAGERPVSHPVASFAPPLTGPVPVAFAVAGSDGRAVDLAVLIPLPSGRGGTVLVVPTETVTQVVPGGAQPISTALISTTNAPGEVKMVSTLEDMLGFRIGAISVARLSSMQQLLAAAGPLTVDLPAPIQPPASATGASFPTGAVTVQPSQVGSFLTDVSNEGATEAAVRFGLLVQAWAEAVHSNRSAAPSPFTQVSGVEQPGPLASGLIKLSRGAVDVVSVPVQEIPAESPGASVEYQVDEAKLRQMIPSLVPGQPSALQARPKIQLLNGTGGLGLDEEAVAKLEPYVQVALSGNACSPQGTSAQILCFGYAKTEIIAYDAIGRADAAEVRRLLGAGEILDSRGSSGIVDMTVIVGADFNASA